MTAAITYNDNKFKELLLHIAERSVDDERFGKTKLNKILFYIDFLAYKNFGEPLTGATYQRRPKGPVPKEIAAARSALFASGEAMPVTRNYMGYPQERLFAKRPADTSLFDEQEMQVIDAVIEALWDKNATSSSNLSHMEPGWRLASEREDIPYASVFIGVREMTADDITRGQELWRELQPAVA
ncbi:Panacea domain-containing protein [uncultured Nocardioides sp.]|uniref:Panacea domain-containing protein n=1 Tax=uncultured Nocardioides sp. TaxID=198441 RepID=UPI0026219EC1|nr:Panacea domain-containing protein [uncultured Nocardioides sp.]